MNLNYMSYHMDADGIAEIIINIQNEKVNTLSSNLMQELDFLMHQVTEESRVKALLIRSGKKDNFIAGADIAEIRALKNAEIAEEKASFGQEILANIEKLPFPSIAVIDGACMGGGLELALACTFRIVSDNPRTKLSLPEVTLGIMPGFGGTVRLPRLIGLAPALDMILTGRAVSGEKAVKIKLADAVFPYKIINEKACEFAHEIIDRKKCRSWIAKRSMSPLRDRFINNTIFGQRIAFAAAEKAVLKKTHGLYPAPLKALAVIKRNFRASPHRAYRLERQGFSSLAGTPESKNLISVFFKNEALKKAYTNDSALLVRAEEKPVRSAAILGAGKMGGGIAWLFSWADIPVAMKDMHWEAVAGGLRAVKEMYNDLISHRKTDRRIADLKTALIAGTVDYSGIASADFVIEAIVEDLSIKKKTLAEIESLIGPDAIIATNTSSLSVNELAADLARPENFVGFHFFNPVSRMPLIEIVRGEKTSDETVYRAVLLARQLGKTPICVKDTNGFLVNRILLAYLNEAILLLEDGADIETIDHVMEHFGMPMGPFALLDEIGIKVAFKVAHILANAFPERSILGGLFPAIGAEESLLGRSAGKGFYIYFKKEKRPNPHIELLRATLKHTIRKISRDEILNRCLLRMSGEAARCLEEGIVASAAEIDMAMILGAGFPPFRGGIMRYMDETGIAGLRNMMKGYETHFGARFAVPQLIEQLALSEGRFYNEI